MPRSRFVIFALPLLVMLGGGCADDDEGRPTPAPRVAAEPEDLAGMLACGALSTALRDGTLMAPGVAKSIITSAGSADAPIADSARRLRAAHASAVRAQGTADEPDAVAGVSGAGSDMLDVCDESGLKTAG